MTLFKAKQIIIGVLIHKMNPKCPVVFMNFQDVEKTINLDPSLSPCFIDISVTYQPTMLTVKAIGK